LHDRCKRVTLVPDDVKSPGEVRGLPEHGQPVRRLTAMTIAHDAHPEEPPHDHQDERPCACNDGWVTIGQTVIDPETGEETEEFALYLCERCKRS
jgi:hypothetical protein